MKRSIEAGTCLMIIMVLGACSGRDDLQADHSFRTFEENGILVAVTSSIPKYDAPLFTFEEVLQLRQDEDRPETLMYQAGMFIRGDDGRFYVTDRGNSRIAVFGADGAFSHSFGRDGEGPGEFRSPMLMYVRDGEACIFDAMLRRTSIFGTDGTFKRTLTSPRSTSMTMYLYPLPDERLVQFSINLIRDDPEEMKLQYIVTTLTTAGDTLGLVESAAIGMGRSVPLPRYRTSVTADRYFGTQSIAMYYPGFGTMAYRTDEPVIHWHGLDGHLTREIRLELDPEPVTDEEKRGIQRELQAGIDNAEDERRKAIAEAERRHALIPDVKAFWDNAGIDDYGYYWIRRFPDYTSQAPLEEQCPRYRLLSPEGEYLGDVEYPIPNAWSSRGMMLALEEDETTGEMIHLVYRMIPAVRGFRYPD